MKTITCSTCQYDLPPSSFAPFRRVHGGMCRACDAIQKREVRRHYSGLTPAEALDELWTRIQAGRRVSKLLGKRIDTLTAQAA